MAAAEEIATRKQRAVTNLKTKISKGITNIPALIIKFKKEFDEQSPFVRHAATKVVDAFEDLESLLKELKAASAGLQNAINNVDGDDETIALKNESIDKELTSYNEKVESARDIHREGLKSATVALNPPPGSTSSTMSTTPSSAAPAPAQPCGLFKANAELKPKFLAENASFEEATHFAMQFNGYIQSGNTAVLSKDNFFLHLTSLIHPSWLSKLANVGYTRDSEWNAFADAYLKMLTIVFPLHQRRMDFLSFSKRAKEFTNKPFDYAFRLSQLASFADLDTLTPAALLMHLFAESTLCAESKKLTLGMLRKTPEGNQAEWTSELLHVQANLQPHGKANRANEGGQTRHCTKCNRDTHFTKDCWGKCRYCDKYGHRSETCRFRANKADKQRDTDKDKAEEPSQEKEKRKKRSRRNKDTAKRSKVEVPPEEPSTSEESAPDTPPRSNEGKRARFVRGAGPGLGSAKRVKVLESINNIRALKANGTQVQRVLGTVSHSINRDGSITEIAIPDSGCSVNIVSEDICRENNLRINSETVEPIIDASGNQLNIVGSTSFFFKSSLFHGKKKRIQAVVLADNPLDREILISHETLMDWRCLPPRFPEPIPDDIYRLLVKKDRSYSKAYKASSEKFNEDNPNPVLEEAGESVPPPCPPKPKVKLRKPSKECTELRNRLIKRFPTVFKSVLGPNDVIDVPPVVLELAKDVEPTYHQVPFDVPHFLRVPADTELRNLLNAGVLERVEHPTDWCSKAFFVPKPNSDPLKARLVADFRQLNRGLRKFHWPSESSSQLLRHLNPKARVWACLDATSGYHQVPVHPDSQDLLTVCTQLGRYKYTRLPMGVTTSSAWFNIVTDGDVRFQSEVYKKNEDDLLVEGAKRHNRKPIEALEDDLVPFLEHCEKKNIKLNPEKFIISEEVVFGGVKISKETIKNNDVVFLDPADGRIAALTELATPRNKKELQSACGLLASLQVWFPQVPLLIPNMRKQCAGGATFDWNDELDAEFTKVKQLMGDKIRLSPFDPDKTPHLILDGANSVGLGYMLVQFADEEDHSKGVQIIAANSTRLSQNQLMLSPMDVELLCLDFSLKGCEYFISHAPLVKVWGDCRALDGLLKKPIADVKNPKHQRILERTQRFALEFTHVTGAQNKIADALSRLCRNTFSAPTMDLEDEPRILKMSKRTKVHQKQLETSDPLVVELAAAADPEYIEATIQIENGVLVKDTPTDCLLREVEGSFSDLSVAVLDNGSKLIIRDGTEVLIPKDRRLDLVQKLHESHGSPDTMFRQTKHRFFWPGLKKQLEDHYLACGPCQIHHQSVHRKENEISDPSVPDLLPGEELSTDFCTYGNRSFLVITDRVSGYIRVIETDNQSTEEAVKALKSWFNTFSAPYRISSDNGPAFRDSFASQMKKLGVTHIPVSAYSPQSNAQAERAVKSLKWVLNRNPNLSTLQIDELVFAINSREQPDGVGSPHSRFFRRPVRSCLPNSVDRSVDPDALSLKRWELKDAKTKSKGLNQAAAFSVGQKVRIQDARTKTWLQTGTIIEERFNPQKTVSYEIDLDGGGRTSRHKSFIRAMAEVPRASSDTSSAESDSDSPVSAVSHAQGRITSAPAKRELPQRKRRAPAKFRN